MKNSFRENLKSELEYQNLTTKELASITGITQSTIGSYLGTRKSLPTVDIAVRIAEALNVSVEYLVTGRDRKIVHRTYEEFLPYRDILKELNSLDKNKLKLLKSIITAIKKWEN